VTSDQPFTCIHDSRYINQTIFPIKERAGYTGVQLTVTLPDDLNGLWTMLIIICVTRF